MKRAFFCLVLAFTCLAFAQSFSVFDLQSLTLDEEYLITESDYEVLFSIVPGGEGLTASLEGEIDMLPCPTCTKYTSENPTLYKQIAFDWEIQSVEIPVLEEVDYEEGGEFEAESALVTLSDEVYSELFLTREYEDVCKVFVPGSYEGKITVEPETEGDYLSISFYDEAGNPALVPVFTHACNSEDTNGPYFAFSVGGMNWKQVNDMGAVNFDPSDSTWVFKGETEGGYDFGLNGQSIEFEQFVKKGNLIQSFKVEAPLEYGEPRAHFSFNLFTVSDVQISVERLVVSEDGLNAVGAYDDFVHQLDDATYMVAPSVIDDSESYDDSDGGLLYFKSNVNSEDWLYWDLEESSFGPHKGVPPGIYEITLEAFRGDQYDSETVILPLEWITTGDWPSVYQYTLPDEYYEKDTVSGVITYDSVDDDGTQRFSLNIEKDGAEFTHGYGTTFGSVGSLPVKDEAFEFSWERQLDYSSELDAIQADLNFAQLHYDYLKTRLESDPSAEEMNLLEAQLDEADLLIASLEGQLAVINELSAFDSLIYEEFTAAFAGLDSPLVGHFAALQVLGDIGYPLNCPVSSGELGCYWTITIKDGGLGEVTPTPQPSEGLSASCEEFLSDSHALGIQQGGWLNCEDCEGYSVYVTGVEPNNPNDAFTVDDSHHSALFYGDDGRDWGLQYANSFRLGQKYWLTVFDEDGGKCYSNEYVAYHTPFCEYTRDGYLQYLISLPYPVNNINEFELSYEITVDGVKTAESASALITDEGEILGSSAWRQTVFYAGGVDAINLLDIGMFGEYYDEPSFSISLDLVRSDNPYHIECSKTASRRGVDLSLEVKENDYPAPSYSVMSPTGGDLSFQQTLQIALSNLAEITQLRPVDVSGPFETPEIESPMIEVQTPVGDFVAEVDEQGQVTVEELQAPVEADVTMVIDEQAVEAVQMEFGIQQAEIMVQPQVSTRDYFGDYLTSQAEVPIQGSQTYYLDGISVDRARGLVAQVENELSQKTFELNGIPVSSFLALMRISRIRETDVIGFLLSDQLLNQYYYSGDILATLLKEQVIPTLLDSGYSREELARVFTALHAKGYAFSDLDAFNRLWDINQQGVELSGVKTRAASFEGETAPINVYLDEADSDALFHDLFLNLSSKMHVMVEWNKPESPVDFIVKAVSWPFGGERPDVKGAKGYGAFKSPNSCFHKDSVVGSDEPEKYSFLEALKARIELRLEACDECLEYCLMIYQLETCLRDTINQNDCGHLCPDSYCPSSGGDYVDHC